MEPRPKLDDQLLLGYDVRQKNFDIEHLWPMQRRQEYLIRPEIHKPLSTDIAVWPSAIDRMIQGYSLTDWIGPLAPIWESLENARSSAKQVVNFCLIAITISVRGLREADISHFRKARGNPVPPDIASNWSFLGYDVSAEGLLSGLTNCSHPYTPEQLSGYRSKWSKHLNSNHLFEDQDWASSFKQCIDQRVPEHAPFFVFGLWLVDA
jgi:hypothetical protein